VVDCSVEVDDCSIRVTRSFLAVKLEARGFHSYGLIVINAKDKYLPHNMLRLQEKDIVALMQPHNQTEFPLLTNFTVSSVSPPPLCVSHCYNE